MNSKLSIYRFHLIVASILTIVASIGFADPRYPTISNSFIEVDFSTLNAKTIDDSNLPGGDNPVVRGWTSGLSQAENTLTILNDNEVIWRDADNDNVGFTGQYVPPFDGNYGVGCTDIQTFQVAADADNLYMLIIQATPGNFWPMYRFVAIDTDGVDGSGATEINQAATSAETNVSDSLAYEFLLTSDNGAFLNDGRTKLYDAAGTNIDDSDAADINADLPGTGNIIAGNPSGAWEFIMYSIPWTTLGETGPPSGSWRFVVGAGFQSANLMGEVEAAPEAFDVGGGALNDPVIDSDVYDLIGGNSSEQAADLTPPATAASTWVSYE
jgi:hypothetical protein